MPPPDKGPPLALDRIPSLIALARAEGRHELAAAIEAELSRARRLGEHPVIRVHETAMVEKFEGPVEPGQRPFETVRSEDLN